ncbi:40S ribosomal protein S2 [Sciurus carolinensis]|uniref:Small ribosomal subunit protein uS5 n=1 Tax=Sciurus carolinensis TaxID=30640 RepID=A0AA41T3Z6_SCICA|nr:40S ribosomal protein S2 [Sciurus carolinensis]
MADDVGAVGGPEGPGPQEWVAAAASTEASAVVSEVMTGAGAGARGGQTKDKEWIPVTKPGCLVKDMKIKSLEETSLFSLPIKESEIIDFFLGASLRDEVLKIMPVQKQAHAGQQTRVKAFVAIGDYSGHFGLGVMCSKERYWHGLSPCAQEAAADGCTDDCYTSARGCTATLGNFAKATFDATSKTYDYLTPDLWKETVFSKSPSQEFTDHPVKIHPRVSVQRTQAPAVATT